MSLPRFTPAGLCLILALASQPLLATSVEPPAFTSLVSQADYVVRGVVTAIEPEWREAAGKPFIASKVTVEVREIIRGNPPSPLVLDMVGGKIGDVELSVDGAPKFNVGDEDILFIKDNRKTFSPLVAVMYGRFPILRDAKTGETFAVRSNGMPLYSEQDVAEPMTRLSAFKQRRTAAKPLTAAAFASKIRETSARNPGVSHAK